MRRLMVTLFSLLVVSVIIFVMARVSGDPRTALLGENASQEQWEAVGRKLGMDKPWPEQYGLFLKDVLRGDLGESISRNEPVIDIIAGRLPATLYLGLTAFMFSVIVGVPLGVLSAVKRGTIIDRFAKVLALLGQSVPPFWLGIMCIFFFAVKLDWVPPSGRQGWNSVLLPALTLGWFFVAANMRMVRSAMLDVLDSEYIKLARGKGVPQRSIIWKHAFRNALIPPLTFAGVTLGSLVTGALVAEVVFAWPGLGQLAIQALRAADYPLMQGVVIIFSLMYMTAALLVDVAYAYIDPRIKYN